MRMTYLTTGILVLVLLLRYLQQQHQRHRLQPSRQ